MLTVPKKCVINIYKKNPSESDGVMEIIMLSNVRQKIKNLEMTCIDPHDCVNVSFFNIDLLYS